MRPLEVWYQRLDAETLIKAAPDARVRKVRQQIADRARERVIENLFPKITTLVDGRHRLVDQPPILVHVAEPDFEQRVHEVLADYRESLPDERRVLLDRYRLEDCALKVVGIGSVGTALLHRAAVLGGRPSADPAVQGGRPLRPRALCRRERVRQPGPARRRGTAAAAVVQRHLPRLGARTARVRFLRAPAARHEDVDARGRIQRRATPALRAGSAAGPWRAPTRSRATPRRSAAISARATPSTARWANSRSPTRTRRARTTRRC